MPVAETQVARQQKWDRLGKGRNQTDGDAHFRFIHIGGGCVHRRTVHEKGTLIPDNDVMAYPEIPDVTHEFAARLQFGTTFEVMEFLAGQQIKLS